MITDPSSPAAVSSAPSRGVAHGLVSRLVSEMLAYFAERAPAMVKGARNHLLNIADGGFHHIQSHNLRSAAMLLGRQEDVFRRAFADALRDCVNEEVINALPQAGFKTELSNSSQNALHGATLSLIDVREVDRILLLDRVSQIFDTFYSERLTTLSQCLAALFELESASLTKNPFRPIVFLRAFLTAWEKGGFDPQASEGLMLSLEPNSFIDVGTLYGDLIGILKKAGIEPAAYRIRMDPQGGVRSNAATSGVNGVSPDASVAQPVAIVYPAMNFGAPTSPGLATAFQARRFLQGLGIGPVPAGVNAADHVQAASLFSISSPVDVILVNYLEDIRNNAVATGLYRYFGGDESVGHNVLRQIVNQKEICQAPEVDRGTVDAMVEVFDNVFSGQEVPTPLKAVIGRLQIPVLKAAMINRNFFLNEDHPARMLMDALVSASVAWTQERGEYDPLYMQIESAVERVVTEFENDLKPFSDSFLGFSEFLSDTEKHAQKRIDLAASRELEVESLTHADEILSKRLTQLSVAIPFAPFLPNFLITQWRKVIAKEWVQDEAARASGHVSKASQTMDQLIWSTQPKADAQERSELLKVLPDLLRNLNEKLDELTWSEEERATFTRRLMTAHTVAIRMNTPPPIDPKAASLVERTRQDVTNELERRKVVRLSDRDDAYAQTVHTLSGGLWFDVTDPSLGHLRCKLSWISPLRTRFIFTDRRGFEAFVGSDNEVATMLRLGRMNMLDNVPVVSTAIGKLMALNDANMQLSA